MSLHSEPSTNNKNNCEDKGKNNKQLYTVNGKTIEYIWPDFRTRFHYEKSICYTTELLDKCEADAYALSNFPKDVSFKNGYRNTAMFAGSMYANCIVKERMEVAMKIMHFYFIIDDHNEHFWGDIGRKADKAPEIWGHFMSIFDKMFGKDVSMLDWKPYIFGFYSCFDRMFANYNNAQKKRCAEVWKGYCRGNLKECFSYDKKFESIEQMLSIRMESIGALPVFQLIEYTEGIFITEEEWNRPEFKELLNNSILSIILVNDLYSFRKELIECGGDFTNCRNIIALQVLLEGLTLQQSVDKLVERIIGTETRMQQFEEEYQKKYKTSRNVKYYFECVNQVVAGNWITHVGLDRYHGVDPEKEVRIKTGKFVFDTEKLVLNENDTTEDLSDFYKLKLK